MVNPVPGYPVSTPYRKTSTGSWPTCGWHTGQDYAAPHGAKVVAARGGRLVRVNYGASFGSDQIVVQTSDGGEDFYAHLLSVSGPTPRNVSAGDTIGEVGSDGNATGPHLHFETHSGRGWSCGLMVDPMPAHNSGGGGGGGAPTYLSKLVYGQMDSDSVKNLQDRLNGHSLDGGQDLPVSGNYLTDTDHEVWLCQDQHGPSWGQPNPDRQGATNVGPKQAGHLGLPDVRDDRANPV